MKKMESKSPAALAKRKKRTAPRIKKVDDQKTEIVAQDEDQLRDLLGTKTQAMGNELFALALRALGISGRVYHDMMAAMGEEMNPRDAVEAMLFSQQVATHVAMMTLSGKVMDAASPQLREGYERSMTRLSRTFLAQMDALKRHRAKAQQVVRVERVDVQHGGQAIVGNIDRGRGDEEK